MLLKRVLTAVIGIPIALLLIYYGRLPLFLVVLALGLIGAREYYYVVFQRGSHPNVPIGYLGVLLLVLLAWIVPGRRFEVGQLLVVMGLVMASVAYWGLSAQTVGAIANGATTLMGSLYASMFAYVLAMRYVVPGAVRAFGSSRLTVDPGCGYVFLLLAVSWLADTAAYAVGRMWGTTRLAPRVSPKKTVEGSVGALGVAMLAGLILGPQVELSPWHGLALGLIGGVLGQVGDLAASALKRDAGVKDFPLFFPGHGGVLDRFDGLLFNAPAFYFYLKYVVW